MPDNCSKKVVLTVTTMIFSCTSFACLCIAISTDYWLYAEELQGDPQAVNLTIKLTTTGLWRMCVGFDKNVPKTCEYINYFSTKEKEDGIGPTDAIIYSMRRSTMFPLVSLLILLVAQIVCFMSHCDRKKKVLTFVSGILFVIAGLCTLIGLILYIGAITEEAGNKSKPSSMDQPLFQYWYGFSFVLTVSSFSTAELTGVLSVYLYISRHKHAYRKKVGSAGGGHLLQGGMPGPAPVVHHMPDNNADHSCQQAGGAGSAAASRPCNGRILQNNNSFYSFAPQAAAAPAVQAPAAVPVRGPSNGGGVGGLGGGGAGGKSNGGNNSCEMLHENTLVGIGGADVGRSGACGRDMVSRSPALLSSTGGGGGGLLVGGGHSDMGGVGSGIGGGGNWMYASNARLNDRNTTPDNYRRTTPV